VATKTKRVKQLQSLYLEPAKSLLVDELSTETRIPKAVLLREAVDMLLLHHGKLSEPSTRTLVAKAIASTRPIISKAATELRGSVWKNNCSKAEEDLAAMESRMKKI
jgi:hypothetical protein